MPNQYTGALAVLDHWQSLVAGLIALVAALLTMISAFTMDRYKHVIDQLHDDAALKVDAVLGSG